MYKLFFALTLALLSFVTLSVSAKGNDEGQYEIEIAEIGKPGEVVVRVWYYSKKANVNESVYKECAINGAMFKGVNDSGRMKGRKPLVADGYDSHKDYFDQFFSNREYQKYARMAMNGLVDHNSLVKVGKLYKVGKIVIISYNELRARLESDNIIKGLNSGF